MSELYAPAPSIQFSTDGYINRKLTPQESQKYTYEIRFSSSGKIYQVRYKDVSSVVGSCFLLLAAARRGVIEMPDGKKRYIVFSKKDLEHLPYPNLSLNQKKDIILSHLISTNRPRSQSASENDSRIRQPQQPRVKPSIRRTASMLTLGAIAPSWESDIFQQFSQKVVNEIRSFALRIFHKKATGYSQEQLLSETHTFYDEQDTLYSMSFTIFETQDAIRMEGRVIGIGGNNTNTECWYIPLLNPEKTLHLVAQHPLAFASPATLPCDIKSAEEGQAHLMQVWDFLQAKQIPNAGIPVSLETVGNVISFLYKKYTSDCGFLIHPPEDGLRYTGKDLSQRVSIADDMLRCMVAVHAEGWIHGDLKPKNLYIADRYPLDILELSSANISFWKAGQPIVVVGDWESAVPVGHPMIASTPEYTPPIDEWKNIHDLAYKGWDIWACAIIIDQLVSGKRREISDFDRSDEIDALIYDLYVNRTPLSEAQIRINEIGTKIYKAPVFTASTPDPFAPPTANNIQSGSSYTYLATILAFCRENHIPYADVGLKAQSSQTCRSLTAPLIGKAQYQGHELKSRLFVMYQVLHCIAAIHKVYLTHNSITADNILLVGQISTDPEELKKQLIPSWQAGLPQILVQGFATAAFVGEPLINTVPEYTPPEGSLAPGQCTYLGWDLYQCGRLFIELVFGYRGSPRSDQSLFDLYPLDASNPLHRIAIEFLHPDPDERLSAKKACIRIENLINQ